HPVAAGGPAEAGGGEQSERRGADSALGGPAAGGTGAEGAGEYADGLLDVPGGARRAPGIGRMCGQLQRGQRIARALEVEQQRDDRMSVGRDRQLALPALGE